MKTVDYENKYKKALDRAKDFMNGEVHYALKRGENIMCWIFPELRESEDEKIRKALLKLVHDTTGDELWVDYNVHKDEALAWLEKQGETHTNKEFDDAWLRYVLCIDRGLEKQDSQILANSEKTCKDEQKPTWSKEDEKMFDSIIEDVMPYGECPDYPTDEEREYFYKGNRKVDWLKSLKDKVQPQPKQEWSEEDEERIRHILSVLGIQVYWDGATGKKVNPYQKEIDWLKSLKQRIGG